VRAYLCGTTAKRPTLLSASQRSVCCA